MNLLFDPKQVSVLVVDDHAPMRKAIRRVINDFNFGNILEASNAEDAFEILNQADVHFIILDLFLTETHGFEIIRNIRDRDLGSDTPILVVTGEASRDDIVKSADLGADGYLLKPFQTQQLVAKVSDILNKFFSPTPILKEIRLAEVALLEEDYAEANNRADKAMESDPESMRARHIKAMALIGLNNSKQAINLLHQSITINPSFFKNYRTLSDSLLLSGFKAEGIEALQKELELNPKQPVRQVKLAKLFASVGHNETAINHFREALKEDGKMSEALMGMGKVYAQSENLEKAFYYFKRLRRYHPESSKSLEAMVKFAVEAKDFKRAEMALKDERSANPKRVDTYIILAKLYASTRKIESALRTIDAGLKIEPENLDALQFKADLLAHSHKLKEAIDIYLLIIKKRPEPMIFSKLAKAYLGVKEFGHAIATYHRLMEMRYDPAGSAMGLGEAYFNTGQIRKAFHCFRSANRQGIATDKLKTLLVKSQRIIMGRVTPNQRNAS